jgi:hypothetical protein
VQLAIPDAQALANEPISANGVHAGLPDGERVVAELV